GSYLTSGKHPQLDGLWRQILQQGVEFRAQVFRRCWGDTLHSAAALGREGRDQPTAVHAEAGESRQVGLDARAATAVSAGNGIGHGFVGWRRTTHREPRNNRPWVDFSH